MNDELTYDQAGLNLTEAAEALRLTAYPDPATRGDPWTIGYGHTGADVYPGLTITRDKAEQLLQADVRTAESAVKRLVRVALTQGQYDALVDFVFNIGETQFASSTLLRKLNAGDYRSASFEFDRWNKAGGRILNGLVKRRDNEEALFNV
jgi:lysozyme